ncbi:hypothetical protein GO730_15025 [Spirosoma sp. HMF3257]|uniref:Uncharacterized protein n=1 Tax=Spirosoma telluris TaxID=2183553 RepID=A0A327NIH7_9BACT|nr:hypothetical protein [Spirosoma telluris]RAI75171.1 hypothetical protein HMF3257_14970 [Spirosoma telluris]
MENTNNADRQAPDQTSGNSLKGLSPQHNNPPENDEGDDSVIYTGLGVNNHPDMLNPGDEEASDTLLFTDTATARHATDAVSNAEEPDEFPDDIADDDLSDDEIEEQITELAEEEEEGNERY